jgi:hypothetical protein
MEAVCPRDPGVSLEELAATVARMEARLHANESPAVSSAFALYRQLVPRFEADLGAAERDVALTKASALMIVEAISQAEAQQAAP